MKVMLLGLHEIALVACLCVIDLRLRILGYEGRMDMTRRIWPSTLPERLLRGTIAGFDELEVLAVGKGFLIIVYLRVLVDFAQ